MSDIPPDVFPNILSWLPVESLLRFRCVCNGWRRIIDDPAFVKLHLKRQSEAGGHLILRFQNKFYTLSTNSICHYSQTPTPTVEVSLRETPTNNGVHLFPRFAYYVSSCNGLILILPEMGKLMLWNPFTREDFLLPPNTYEYSSPFKGWPGWKRVRATMSPNGSVVKTIYCDYIGLGYDFVSDDYKVVKIVEYGSGWKTMIYSLKFNSWSIILNCPSFTFVSHTSEPGVLVNGVFFNGYLNWIIEKMVGNDKKERAILAFDLVTEVYHLIPFPNIPVPLSDDLPRLDARLDALGESLLLTIPDDSVYRIDGYGVKNYSWTKFFSFGEIGLTIANYRMMIPIAYNLKNKGEVLLVDDYINKHYCLVNIESKSAKEIDLHDVAPDYYSRGCQISQNCLAGLVRINNYCDTADSSYA